MPYVNIKITKEGATADKKAQLIKGVTQLLADVLGKNPQTTVVVIDEVGTDNWGIGGETLCIIRLLLKTFTVESLHKGKFPESQIQFSE